MAVDEVAVWPLLVRTSKALSQRIEMPYVRPTVLSTSHLSRRRYPKGETVIQVGKVITKSARAINNFGSEKEEGVTVWMADDVLTIGFDDGRGGRLTPQQAIELAQLLMKAAECQTEYAKAAKDLEDQKDKLNAKYKDMISGLGLDNPDLKVKDLTLAKQAWSGVVNQ